MYLECDLICVYIIGIKSIAPETVQGVAKRRANFGHRRWKWVKHAVHGVDSSATRLEGYIESKPNISDANLHI